MKKLLAIILTAALLMSVCGVSAFAAEDDQPSLTSGPWDGRRPQQVLGTDIIG